MILTDEFFNELVLIIMTLKKITEKYGLNDSGKVL